MVNLGDTKAKNTYSNFLGHIIDPGPPIEMEGHYTDVNTTLQNTRTYLNEPGMIVFSKEGCKQAIKGMQNWKFPMDRVTRLPRTDSDPEHGRWSHVCKAILYLIDDIFKGSGMDDPDVRSWNYPARKVSVR